MSENKSIIERAKEAISKAFKPEEIIQLKEEFKVKLDATPTTPVVAADQPATSKEAKLQDGTVVSYTGDTLAVGSDITTVTPEGALPLADGDYVLEDGTSFSVQGGKVSQVGTAEAADAELAKKAEMEAETKVKERVTKIVETFKSEMDAKFKAQEEKINEIVKEKEAIELKLAKVTAANTKQEELLDVLLSVPTAQPTEKRSVILTKANDYDALIKKAQKAQESKTKK